MRTYLVVIDESRESEIAMRFAARRAVKTGGGIEILALLPTPEFVQWGGVMATMDILEDLLLLHHLLKPYEERLV